MVGQLATGLDDSAKAAVVYFVPDDSRDRVMEELAYVQDKIPGTRSSELNNHDGRPDTTGLEDMVRADVQSSTTVAFRS